MPEGIGEQPERVVSDAPAKGMMGGAYQMETESGERFDIEIPTFSLDRPNQGAIVNGEIDIVGRNGSSHENLVLLGNIVIHDDT